MRRALKGLAVIIGIAAGSSHAGEIDAARQRELLHLLRHDCGSCHGLTMKGGLGAPLLPTALAEKPDAALVAIILDGIKGTPMPPWRGELSEPDASWIVRALRGGLDHVE